MKQNIFLILLFFFSCAAYANGENDSNPFCIPIDSISIIEDNDSLKNIIPLNNSVPEISDSFLVTEEISVEIKEKSSIKKMHKKVKQNTKHLSQNGVDNVDKLLILRANWFTDAWDFTVDAFQDL